MRYAVAHAECDRHAYPHAHHLMRSNDDPTFLLDCDRCGQTYGVHLDCDHGFSRFVALVHPRLCPDCEHGHGKARLIAARALIKGGEARRGR